MEEVYAYDARDRLTTLTTRTSGGTTRLAQTYTYDDASNVLTHTKGPDTTTYTYDDLGQLESETRPGYSGSYTYDANGNRASRTVGGVTETFHNDAGDKLTHITVGTTTVKSFTYDAAGRTTRVTVGANQTDLEYDFESRVTRILKSGTTTNTFTYNGLSARVGKVDSGGTLTYRRAGAGVLSPVLGDGSATYTPGISERRGSTTTYAHTGLKSAEAQSQSGQTITASRQYDAFGNVSSSTGTFQGYFGYAGPFGYQEDSDHSLRLLGHRYYDSDTGRFLTRDPIKDGRNWYVYCDSNPTSDADPYGLAKIIIGWRPVADNGSHSFILIIDEDTGEQWTISGGPHKGKLVDKSGLLNPGKGRPPMPENYEFPPSKWGGGYVIVDDDRSGQSWFNELVGHADKVHSAGVPYQVLGTNSNSFVFNVLALAGLLDEFNKVWKDKGNKNDPGTRGDRLWFPGWGIEIRVR